MLAIPSPSAPESETLREADDQNDAINEDLRAESGDPEYEQETRQFFPETRQSYVSCGTPTCDGEAPSPEDFVPTPIGLRERLLAQLDKFHLVEEQRRIALFVVEGLDSRGDLIEDAEEGALCLRVSTK